MRLTLVGLLCLLVVDIGIAAVVFNGVGQSTSSAPVDGASSERVEPLRVVVFGDAFARGGQVDTGEGSWVDLLAEDEGWIVDNLAQQRKSYGSFGKPICGRDRCASLLSREEVAAIGSPDLILVSGGRSFVESPPSSEQKIAIKSFYRKLRKSFPESDVAAINPLWDATSPPISLASVSANIDSAVSRIDGTFLDIGQPLVGNEALIDADTGRPNDEGQETIARAVASAMSESDLVA